MAREAADWARVRRHASGSGVYVYVPEEVLKAAGVDHAQENLVVRRYVLRKGDVLLRFRTEDRVKGWAIEPRRPKDAVIQEAAE